MEYWCISEENNKSYTWRYTLSCLLRKVEMVAWDRERGELDRQGTAMIRYLQRALLLRATFTGNWYRATSQLEAACHPPPEYRPKRHDVYLLSFTAHTVLYPLRWILCSLLKTSEGIYFSGAYACILRNSRGISAVPCLPKDTDAHPVLKSTK